MQSKPQRYKICNCSRSSYGTLVYYMNRPLPSYKNPHFPNEAKCCPDNLSCRNNFYLHENDNHFHIMKAVQNLFLILKPGKLGNSLQKTRYISCRHTSRILNKDSCVLSLMGVLVVVSRLALLRFSQTCELLSSKAAFTIAFFAAVNHNYDHKQRTLKHRNTQNGSKSTNRKSQTMTF